MSENDLPESLKTKLVQSIKSKPIQENGMNLLMRLGERLHLQIYNANERLWGELVGFKQGEFLLVWLPNLTAHRKILADNSEVTLRGMNVDFQLCGFTTTISKILLTPYPLLFLTFPKVFEKLHLRRHDRVECFLPAQVLLDGNEYKAMIVNLSLGGARIILNKESAIFSPEQFESREIYLVFKTVDNGKEAYAKSLVRSARNNDSKLTLGLEFLDLIGESYIIIHKYVASIKEYYALKQE
ncbi:PilZ domain-containing protein [Desulfonatronum thiodismutans]|uniref:PilZ domain-containing protein n=1 Tax=Desulfonatronum thiodismutans TaxID=159290 RepID=UPI0004ABE22E|nr:PilZ domain-containing protein [Desulfonatronum thiodismutans]